MTGFVCPRCRQEIEIGKDHSTCKACRTNFPHVAGVPWLFRDPQGALAEWKNRFDYYIQNLLGEANEIEKESRSPDLTATTRERLAISKDLRLKQAQAVRALVDPLGMLAHRDKDFHQAVHTQIPQNQGLNSYYVNLHRDWVWGEKENRASLDLVLKTWGHAPAPGRLAVLGAGASRLAYDLHLACGSQETWAVDINPLLLLAAKKIIGGETVELVEFPPAPLDAKASAVAHTLKAPRAIPSGFHFLFADATDLPMTGLQTLVTPWFIDIVPQEPAALFHRLNASLAPQGVWINFGSLAFQQRHFSQRLSLEETREQVQAAGFKFETLEQQVIPYLQSPHSRFGRVENVICFKATKIAEAAPLKQSHFLPEWITDPRRPVPLTDAVKSQAFVSRIHLEVLALVDGQRSIGAIAAALASHYKMTPLEAEQSVTSFFTKLFEDRYFEKI